MPFSGSLSTPLAARKWRQEAARARPRLADRDRERPWCPHEPGLGASTSGNPVRKTRTIIVIGAALLLAGLFVRLGFWQVSRYHQRVAANRVRATRASEPRLDWSSGTSEVPSDTTGLVWRRVRARGRYDRDREVVLRGRSFEGRPGVEVLTPLIVGDVAILVLRGWLASPDGLRVDLSRSWPAIWSDSNRVTVEGTLIPDAAGHAGQPLTFDRGDGGGKYLVLAGADLDIIGARLPYPLRPQIIRLSGGGRDIAALRELPLAEPGNGPHAGYAIQWFSFALITIIGTGILLRRERTT